MKCLKCGTHFHPSDIVIMEDDDKQICDLCAVQGECYIFSYDGIEVAICGRSFEDILQKWQEYQKRKQKFQDDEFFPASVESRKIEHVIVDEHLD